MYLTYLSNLFACIFILGFCCQASFACMYGPPYATVCEKYANSDAIVVGKVTRVNEGGVGQLVKLQIQQTYKGSVKGSIELNQPLSSCDWDFSDEIGNTLLLYLSKNKGKSSFHAIGAGYGGLYERENEDLYWLNGLPVSLKRNRISGTIELYKDEPFDFLNSVSGVPIIITSGKRSYNLFSDKNGVYEIWDVPKGKYKVTPTFDKVYKLRFPLSLGDIEFKRVSVDQVDTKDFQVIIGKEKCGGSDFILNSVNE